uniref:endonuclease domain-containing protein n=2 Tax=Sphingomonas sp. KC8 TaxID=1030157 RepID=UPI0002488B4C
RASVRTGALGNARHMRSEPTEAERHLWQLLRAKRLSGWKFRRQQPIGRYIVDFYCSSARLIVEADGSQHLDSVYDAERDAWLVAQGLTTLRFWNNDILNNPEGVLAGILAALEASRPASRRTGRTPLPNPSPARGEGLERSTHG